MNRKLRVLFIIAYTLIGLLIALSLYMLFGGTL